MIDKNCYGNLGVRGGYPNLSPPPFAPLARTVAIGSEGGLTVSRQIEMNSEIDVDICRFHYLNS
jgi:hypothetical protein